MVHAMRTPCNAAAAAKTRNCISPSKLQYLNKSSARDILKISSMQIIVLSRGGDQTVGELDGVEKNHKLQVAVAASATVVLGVGNRVLFKLALVPLKHYPSSSHSSLLSDMVLGAHPDSVRNGFRVDNGLFGAWLCIFATDDLDMCLDV
ncbi:conserved hypothetical protein [Ricinus communis]|uniref:Uncharacterized protein n=1 Tax=Ricinus communis TaxID=3988 RepID=B9SAN1_RICCO|nr:conserved hypothetical protein [Ricinus communis]